ncbi:hypothetical protein [Rhizobium sp. L1K21]|uniref:hypothetical protein n=1 Tax=Rhizobium sp. L1K21 TaxID=2954933 RepID=UPI002093E6F7|nr:hypothetical protein [Rhizobium sp. L1K21]MCO6186206.1 hypothetical protein [Rhizobium sp. L1K21]
MAALASVSSAEAGDNVFFSKAGGNWKGPGEIVAGKYKGTKFNCDLKGEPNPAGQAGLVLDGTCRVGIFNQPMKATIARAGNTYKGTFLDGADGKGLDIISGNVSGNKVIVGLNRKNLTGAMIARMKGADILNVTISIKVEDTYVPVIGMTLNRNLEDVAAANQ